MQWNFVCIQNLEVTHTRDYKGCWLYCVLIIKMQVRVMLRVRILLIQLRFCSNHMPSQFLEKERDASLKEGLLPLKTEKIGYY